jgi:putative tryptophan/tyrosine transport system substrate-binding protein
MKRRALLAVFSGAVAARSFIGSAQERGRIYHLGFLVQSQRPQYSALIEELRHHGFVEGVNLVVDSRGFGTGVESLEAIAVEVVKASPDAIYAGGDAAGRAAQKATSTIPIAVIADDVLKAVSCSRLHTPAAI